MDSQLAIPPTTYEFPSEWAKFKSAGGGVLAYLAFQLLPQHFPIWAVALGLKLGATGGVSNGIKGIEFFAEMTNATPVNFYDGSNTATAKKEFSQGRSVFGTDGRQSCKHRSSSCHRSVGSGKRAVHRLLRQQRNDGSLDGGDLAEAR